MPKDTDTQAPNTSMLDLRFSDVAIDPNLVGTLRGASATNTKDSVKTSLTLAVTSFCDLSTHCLPLRMEYSANRSILAD